MQVCELTFRRWRCTEHELCQPTAALHPATWAVAARRSSDRREWEVGRRGWCAVLRAQRAGARRGCWTNPTPGGHKGVNLDAMTDVDYKELFSGARGGIRLGRLRARALGAGVARCLRSDDAVADGRHGDPAGERSLVSALRHGRCGLSAMGLWFLCVGRGKNLMNFGRLGVVAALVASATMFAGPAGAAVRDCRAPSHIGSNYSNVGNVSARNMACSTVRRAIERGHLTRGGNPLTHGFGCYRLHTYRAMGTVLGAKIRCVSGARAFRFDWAT